MSGLNKITIERNQKALLELVAQPGNDICADCKARNPRWASYNLGIFICVNCASIHRKIGTHITKVKSLTMDTWTKEQVENMKTVGNVKSNAIYNPNEVRHPPPANLVDSERDSELEQYIRAKYEYKRYLDRNALVASKLGPSRSASSITSSSSTRSVSNPVGAKSSTNNISSSSPTQAQLQRPSAIAGVGSNATAQNRSVSQPLSALQTQSNPPSQLQQPTSSGQRHANGVWADLISLQGPSANSSLPLQYQIPPTLTTQPTALQMGALPTGNVMSTMNPHQSGVNALQNPISINPFSQQQPLSAQPTAFTSAIPTPFNGTPFTPGIATPFNSTGQALFANHGQIQPPPQSPFFQPQPTQVGLQVQIPSAAPFSSSPFASAPAAQSQFLTPSPLQPLQSHSPQPFSQPAGQFLSHGPQPQFGPGTMPGNTPGLMFANPAQSQIQMPVMTGLHTPQTPFMSQTPTQGFQPQPFASATTYPGQQWGPL